MDVGVLLFFSSKGKDQILSGVTYWNSYIQKGLVSVLNESHSWLCEGFGFHKKERIKLQFKCQHNCYLVFCFV